MAIQMRRGPLAKYNKNKMLAGEWGISIDSDTNDQKAMIAFAPGVDKEIMFVEDAAEQIAEATAKAIDTATEEAEAWAHGNYFHVNDYASGNGSTRSFTLAQTPSSILGVYVDGAAVTAYTRSGKTITFTTAPAAGQNNIRVYYTVSTSTDNAKYYKEQAASSSSSASSYASQAADSMNIADQAANAAFEQAQSASSSAQTASTQATAAATSATNASSSATAASTSAGQAESSATAASTSATEARAAAATATAAAETAQDVADSIPADYSQMSADVDTLKADTTSLKEEITDNDTDISVLQTSVTNLGTHKVAQPLDSNNQPTNGTSGQSLRTKGDGTTEWADVGLPTDEQTAQAVSDWLDDHPEATTTVQDHSLTYEKLVLGTLGFVTPEMYGAKGDGTTDDTNAIQQAVSSSKYVRFEKKTYKTGTIIIDHSDTIIDFGNCDIICTDTTFLECKAEFDDLLYTGSYTVNTNKITALDSYIGLVFIDSAENVMPGRDYYQGGTTVVCSGDFINTPIPYSLTECNMYGQTNGIKNITIKNIASISGGTSTTAPLIYFSGVYDVCIQNVNFTGLQYYGILVERCSNVLIHQCDINQKASFESYGIDIYDGSTFVTIDHCKIYSSIWHCITTGGHHTNMHTRVINSELCCCYIDNPTAYGDHGNTIDTQLINCVCTNNIAIADGAVIDCALLTLSGTTPNNRISLAAWVGDYYHSHINIINCRAYSDRLQLLTYFDILNPTTSGTEAIIDYITISNCSSKDRVDLAMHSTTPSSILTGFVIKKIFVNQTYNIDFLIGAYAETSYVSDSSIRTLLNDYPSYTAIYTGTQTILHISNCTIANMNNGTKALTELYMDNCKNPRTGAKVFNVTDKCFINNCFFNSNISLTDLVTSCLYSFNGYANNITDLYKDANSETYYYKNKPYNEWQSS